MQSPHKYWYPLGLWAPDLKGEHNLEALRMHAGAFMIIPHFSYGHIFLFTTFELVLLALFAQLSYIHEGELFSIRFAFLLDNGQFIHELLKLRSTTSLPFDLAKVHSFPITLPPGDKPFDWFAPDYVSVLAARGSEANTILSKFNTTPYGHDLHTFLLLFRYFRYTAIERYQSALGQVNPVRNDISLQKLILSTHKDVSYYDKTYHSIEAAVNLAHNCSPSDTLSEELDNLVDSFVHNIPIVPT